MADDVRYALQLFLTQNGLPLTLLDFLEQEIEANLPQNQILDDLRATPEYQQAFPENALRKANGFDWWPEQQILQQRSEISRLTQNYLGVTPTAAQMADIIGHNKSLSEWEAQLNTYAQQTGPNGDLVKQVLGQELGHPVDDATAYAFLSPDLPTPQLDRAWTMAEMRAQPAQLGLGVRPEDEAKLLMQYGISAQQAFTGYQNIGQELPWAERMQAIERQIQGQDNLPKTAGDLIGGAPFATLFRALQLNDPIAKQALSQTMAQEFARWQGGGGPTGQGMQATGLLGPGEKP